MILRLPHVDDGPPTWVRIEHISLVTRAQVEGKYQGSRAREVTMIQLVNGAQIVTSLTATSVVEHMRADHQSRHATAVDLTDAEAHG